MKRKIFFKVSLVLLGPRDLKSLPSTEDWILKIFASQSYLSPDYDTVYHIPMDARDLMDYLGIKLRPNVDYVQVLKALAKKVGLTFVYVSSESYEGVILTNVPIDDLKNIFKQLGFYQELRYEKVIINLN